MAVLTQIDNMVAALTTPPTQPAPVPVEWMEMVAVNLLREGVNKHKARELAEHFYSFAPAAQPAPVPLTDEQKRELIKKSELWDMHIHMGWYSAPAKSFVEKTIQLIADIEAAYGITKGQP
jgi:hypothetical protein